jgi:hypothetical protein
MPLYCAFSAYFEAAFFLPGVFTQPQVYTDTFCQKPAEKSAEVMSSLTKSARDKAWEYISTIGYKFMDIFER